MRPSGFAHPRPSLPVALLLAAPLLATLAALLPAFAAAAEPPRLRLPIDCIIGETCFIQNHVDTDPGPGYRDYACGSLGYDGDTGTDFRLPSFAEMRAGVRVLAAADGVVKGVRDGMADTGSPPDGAASLEGRLAGNAVVLDHGNGWETQYGHLRQGSVSVQPGDVVRAGQSLGLVGYSGNTRFPHVEVVVRKDGVPVDPFLGAAGFAGCDGPRAPLWTGETAAGLAYMPTGVLHGGFADRPVADAEVRDGQHRNGRFDTSPEQLVFWVELFGVRAGDTIAVRVVGPGERRLFSHSVAIPRNNAVVVLSAPVSRPSGGFGPGAYVGDVSVLRSGSIVAAASRTVAVGR